MYAYKSNSPDYLDYIASIMTREEILADPDKCLLLENIYIKDNMEIALRWANAKNGTYQDKYEFVEYLMCNGTELDADTILHYRKKCESDPVYKEIAYGYFNDGETVKQLRKQKYKKEEDDCFTNPCQYLGRFSAIMGALGDVKATYSPFNRIATWLNGSSYKNEAEAEWGCKLRQGLCSKEEYNARIKEAIQKDEEEERRKKTGANDKVLRPSKYEPPEGKDAANKLPCVGNGRPCYQQAIIPGVYQGWNSMIGSIYEGAAEFCRELLKARNCVSNGLRTGDWMVEQIGEFLDLSAKANVKRNLGDCQRLWSQVRRFRLFGEENAYGVVGADQLVGDTEVNGQPKKPIAKNQSEVHEMTRTIENPNT